VLGDVRLRDRELVCEFAAAHLARRDTLENSAPGGIRQSAEYLGFDHAHHISEYLCKKQDDHNPACGRSLAVIGEGRSPMFGKRASLSARRRSRYGQVELNSRLHHPQIGMSYTTYRREGRARRG